MGNKNSWIIYIVGHKAIDETMINRDTMFNNKNYIFLNVGAFDTLENSENYQCINQTDLPNFVSLGKWWAESEGMYNIWRSGVYKKLEYIGFIHYDKELCLIRKNLFQKPITNITERINQATSKHEKLHISFETHDLKADYAQKIMADPNMPNELVGDGRNCYDFLIELYNEYFQTFHTWDTLKKQKNINLCSCLLVDITTFDKMMKFFDWIINEKKLDEYDTEHQYRFQGGMAERIFGLFLLLENLPFKDLSLHHHWNKGLK